MNCVCLFFFIAVCLINLSNSSDVANDGALVSTALGKIKGSLMETRKGRKIYAFRGIRYAEPPVGDNRFKLAIPTKPWTDTFDASVEGPSCIQPYQASNSSEDCLRLNVYTTELPKDNAQVKRPVIVYIHPGGFYVFSGRSHEFGPEYLMDQDVVLVTINYRLASLGFLSTGDATAPGNLGMKDQVVALKWVRDNIEKFGGDPNSVTITGCSAGSWSVILHMLSPMSQGLFHRIIASSGAPTKQGVTPKHQKHLAIKQAEILGCPTDDMNAAFECMKTKPAEEFGKSLQQFFEWYGDPILVFRPVIEPEVPGVERFLTDEPEVLIQKGQFTHVPVITGVTQDEFGYVVVFAIYEAGKGNLTIFDEVNEDFYKLAPISFLYERNTPNSRHITDKFKEFYFGNKNLSVENIPGWADLYNDAIIGFSQHRFVNLISATCTKPVYYYNFKYQGRLSHGYYVNTTTPYGVAHHDDMIYVFYMENKFPKFNATDPEVKTVERMTKLYAHFAKTGEPLPANDELFDKVQWERYTPGDKKYLEIGENLSMKSNLKSKRMAVWDELFPVKSVTK